MFYFIVLIIGFILSILLVSDTKLLSWVPTIMAGIICMSVSTVVPDYAPSVKEMDYLSVNMYAMNTTCDENGKITSIIIHRSTDDLDHVIFGIGDLEVIPIESANIIYNNLDNCCTVTRYKLTPTYPKIMKFLFCLDDNVRYKYTIVLPEEYRSKLEGVK